MPGQRAVLVYHVGHTAFTKVNIADNVIERIILVNAD